MRILFSTNLPSPYRVDFFKSLGELTDLTVSYERANASDRNNNSKNETISYNYKEVYLESIKIGAESGFSFQLISIIRKNKFDAIVISGYSSPTSMITMLYMIIKKIPFILSVDGGLIRRESNIIYRIKKFFISRASLCLSTGMKTSEFLKHYGAKLDNIKVYPFTSVKEDDIQSSFDQKLEFKQKLNILEKKIILSVGQFIPRKGLDVLIKSCEHIGEEVGIYIVGGTPTDEYLKLKYNLKLENLHFIDFKSKGELADYYKSADIFVLPTREDIWGLVVNEALAKGIPTITTYNCIAGTELIINGFNGFLVNVDDIYDLESKIKIILDDNNLRKSMHDNCIETIKNYTIEKMALICFAEIDNFVKTTR